MENQVELIEFLLEGDHCAIHINPAFPGTIVPDNLKASPTVTLTISYHFAGSLEVTADKIVTTLIFNGSPFTCTIPMGAIWGVTSEYGVHTTWDDKAPHPMLPVMLKKDQKEQKEPVQLKAVTEPASKKEKKEKTSTKKERPDFLKRIK